ncbi:DUF6731 family protein [Clostridium senegalense]|uniref:Uncharacterized protein n=1 Tax=Clostridium senegalense TaxID=1465809 RepID=A0A6M0H2L4_9CLOT|nr:DUF6731 family protein [Clostridium senegalense]NEU05020.1 hypothetical protein [Clostridium senegalense]
MSVKNMKVYYYLPICGKEKNSKILELTTLFEYLKGKNRKERLLKTGEETIQLKRIEYKDEVNRWELCFLRNRNDAPFISKIDDEGKAIKLDPNEFVGEEVCLIYDEATKVIALQNNRYSVSFNGIAEFFRSFLDMSKLYKFYLSPITYSDKYKEISDDMLIKYRSLIVSFTDVDEITKLIEHEEDGSFEDIKMISKIAKNIDANSGKIELGVGRDKNSYLKKKRLKNLVNFFKKHNKLTKSLKVKMVDNDTIKVIDLINYKVYDDIKINISKDDPKTFDKILTQINAKFELALDESIKEIACNLTED